MTQDYGALYDTKVHDNVKNMLTKQDFINFCTLMDADGPINEYKSAIANFLSEL